MFIYIKFHPQVTTGLFDFLMQSEIIFPLKNAANWYTKVSAKPLGSGAYGHVYLVSDDRGRIEDLQEIAQAGQEKHGLLKSSIDKQELTWNEDDEKESIIHIMSVLSLYTWSSLYKFILELTNSKEPNKSNEIQRDFLAYIKSQKNDKLLSKYKMMHSIVQYIGEVDIERVERVVDKYVTHGRPQRALKVNPRLPPALILDKEIAVNQKLKLEKRQENATRTEVFALGSISSETFVDMRDEEKLLEPDGCQMLLNSPLVSCLFDYFKDPVDRSTCMVTNYVHGYSLHWLLDSLHQKFNRNVGLDTKFVWYVAWSMFNALNLIHGKHIIHNDIKLENIMFDTTSGSLILLDFGLACHSAVGAGYKVENCDSQGGTPMYASPEQVNRGLRVFASDMWALGVVLWELAVGQEYNANVLEEQGGAKEIFASISKGAIPDTSRIPTQSWKGEKLKEMLDLIFVKQVTKRLTSDAGLAFIQQALQPFSSQDDPLAIGQWLKNHIGNPLDTNPLSSENTRPTGLKGDTYVEERNGDEMKNKEMKNKEMENQGGEPRLKKGKVATSLERPESMVRMPFMTP